MSKKFFFWVVLFSVFYYCTEPTQKIYQWRGDNRDGMYHENDLLASWPSEGPELLWVSDSVGLGYGSPVITGHAIYVNGMFYSTGYLVCLDMQGKIRWKSPYGKEWTKNFVGSRSTPTVVDTHVYVCGGLGDIACFSSQSGDKIWHKNMFDSLGAVMPRFGISESLLVEGDVVYCTPGGNDTTMAALNRHNGELIWVCDADSEMPSYSSPLLFVHHNRKIITTHTKQFVIGVDAITGELLWKHKQLTKGQADVHGNTPFYDEDHLYYVTGAGNFAVKLWINEKGDSIQQVWQNKEFDNIFGGFVKFNNHLYASGYRKKYWKALDCQTGQVVDTLSGFDRGNTICVDSMLICYDAKGKVALIKPGPKLMKVNSQFRISHGTKEHFAHQVVDNGILYIRHGNALIAYHIGRNKNDNTTPTRVFNLNFEI
jgi:outer membrane protein assembly factor BamB